MLIPLHAMSHTREAILKGHQPLNGCPSVRQLPSCAVATGLFILASHVRCEHLGQSSPFGVTSDVVCVISYFTRWPPSWDSLKLRLNITRSRHPLISSKSPNPHPQKSNSPPSGNPKRHLTGRSQFGSQISKKPFKTLIHSTFSKKHH